MRKVCFHVPTPTPHPHHLGGSMVGGAKFHIWFPLCQTHQRHSALEPHPGTHFRTPLYAWHPENSFRRFSHGVVLLMYCPYIVISIYNIFDMAAISMSLGPPCDLRNFTRQSIQDVSYSRVGGQS